MNKTIQCIIVDDEAIAREILENHLSKIDSVKVVASCKNALEAFKVINMEPIDLVFLDINMPEISGLSFAKSMTKQIKIIFTTAYREYAVDGFDLKAVDYLLKPISFERLLQSINKYFDENATPLPFDNQTFNQEDTDSLFVRAERKMIRINFTELSYVESIGDYIKMHLRDKTVVSRETMSSIEAKLPPKDFLRIHRSFIVAINSIDSFTNEYVEVDKKQLSISRSYKDEVLRRLENGQ
jgi:two-component system LytT family response regulator